MPQLQRFRTGFAGFVVGLLAAAAGLAFAPAAAAQTGNVKLEWLTWSFFRITSPTGKVILTNPWITGNPDAEFGIKLDEVGKADLILVADAHRDEVGDAVAIAKATGARIVTPSFELGTVLAAQGVPEAQIVRGSPGERYVWEGITVRRVGSVHGSGGTDPSSKFPIYGGVAGGFMVTFENGYTIYFTGSSAATQDMAMWAGAYKPDAMIFLLKPASEPADTAMAIKLVQTGNPGLKTLIPHHQRVKAAPGAPTVAEMRKLLDAMGVNLPISAPAPKQALELAK